jgi:glycosyltransferase involved in cell wall biosynthesis
VKVLLVSQYFWPETFGINALVRSLSERGVQVTVLTGKPNYPEGRVFNGYTANGVHREYHMGIEVIRLPLFPRGSHSGLRLALNYLSFMAAGAFVAPWLLRGRVFDVVFVYAPSPLLQALPAVWLARLKRAPLAVWVQDLWPESLSATGFIRNPTVLNQVARVVRYIYRHTDRILVPSEAFRTPIETLIGNRAEIRYYPNAWVDEPVEGEANARVDTLAGELASAFSVVFAGNLGTAQALDTVVTAAALLQQEGSEARIFLIGSGSQSDWLKSEIDRLNLRNVSLPGRFPPAAMPQLYAAAGALLVSLRDEPIFALTIPSKVQGYLAAGRPIVASLNGEGARVVDEAKAGFSCRAGDARGLADAIQAMSRLSHSDRADMGDNARRYAREHFSLDQLTDNLMKQFNDMVSARQHSQQEKSL